MLYDKRWETKPEQPAQELDPWRSVLLRAADLVDAGWCQRAAHECIDGKHFYCALGALDWVADRSNKYGNWYAVAVDRLDSALGYFYNIPDWNDSLPSDTGAAIVSAKMREVARKE